MVFPCSPDFRYALQFGREMACLNSTVVGRECFYKQWPSGFHVANKDACQDDSASRILWRTPLMLWTVYLTANPCYWIIPFSYITTTRAHPPSFLLVSLSPNTVADGFLNERIWEFPRAEWSDKRLGTQTIDCWTDAFPDPSRIVSGILLPLVDGSWPISILVNHNRANSWESSQNGRIQEET